MRYVQLKICIPVATKERNMNHHLPPSDTHAAKIIVNLFNYGQ